MLGSSRSSKDMYENVKPPAEMFWEIVWRQANDPDEDVMLATPTRSGRTHVFPDISHLYPPIKWDWHYIKYVNKLHGWYQEPVARLASVN